MRLRLVHTEPPANTATDGDIVRRVVAGDVNAYGTLVSRHQRVIYRHLRGMGLDHDTSLDLVQDAFIKAYDRLAACHEPDRFAGWLFRIARNLCLDHLRNIRQQTVPMSSLAEVDEIPAPTPAPAADDTQDALRTALEQLSAPLREAFLLKHAAGYTYEEVAEMTDATPSAVKMRVHRARETLRAFLTAEGVNAA